MKGILVKGMLALLAVGILAAMIAPAMSDDGATSATVNNAAPNVTVTDNISPDPAIPNVTITVNGTLSDANGLGDVTSLVYEVKNTTGVVKVNGSVGKIAAWSFTFVLPDGCDGEPGTWTVEVNATDKGGLFNTSSETFNVSEYAAISVGDMDYGAVAVGSVNNTGSHTVTNDGNIAIKFVDGAPTGYDNNVTDDGIEWSDMINATGTIGDGNITTTWNSATSIACGNNSDVSFLLNVPVGTPFGSYTGNTTFTATKA